ncbi:RNA-binding S4 domain-containing protein [Mycoplasmopsis californica]|uniref:RNA-binding S4 domain-containing protein n=1 Tax=Mycoplasmopsis californica TaxID=2113 RepID=UPI0005972172|nr:RNA-binding S4 domain-containing protein [Mycoplasmopsis californica]
MAKIVKIEGEFITIGQFLKKEGLVQTGGQSKYYLMHNDIKINDNKPSGRNTKVFKNDVVWINGVPYFVKSI